MSNDNALKEQSGKPDKQYDLIVNKAQKNWPKQFITGAEIKVLAGSPSDWVVNQLLPHAGEDPEIGDVQPVDLDHTADPKGIKRFQTRKPTTSPGSWPL